MKYSVIQPEVRSAHDSVVGLWPANQPTAQPSRYPWYYLDNPLGPGTVFQLTRENVTHAPTLVGWTGFGPRRIWHAGESLSAVDHADFVVSRGHRSLLPALTLQRRATEYAAAIADVAYGFPNEHAIGIFQRLGYKPLGRMGRFVKVLRRAAYIGRKIPVPFLPSIAGSALDIWAGLPERLAVRRIRAVADVQWVERFDERFDAFAARVGNQYRLIGHRDAAFLHWRFRPDQVGRPLIAAVLDRDSKELRAYAVVIEKEPGVAQFGDFLAGSAQDLGILLDAIVPVLRARGFSSVTALFLGAPWVGQVLQAHGFAFRGAPRVVTIRANPNRVDSSTILQADNWYMTPADRDF